MKPKISMAPRRPASGLALLFSMTSKTYKTSMFALSALFFVLQVFAASTSNVASSKTLVFFGDSITAGYGLDSSEAYPHWIDGQLKAKGFSIKVVNAGSSGDTTASGLRREDWVLKQKPTYFVIALGGNDMLRGVPVQETQRNLFALIDRAKHAGARPILLGLKALPNLGPAYVKSFEEMYRRVAQKTETPLLPFFIEDVAGKPELNQPDGIHPTREGQLKIAKRVLEFIEPILK